MLIRDLDDVGAVEPVATLGGELPEDALTKEEKKKQQKVQSTAQYMHIVLNATDLDASVHQPLETDVTKITCFVCCETQELTVLAMQQLCKSCWSQ